MQERRLMLDPASVCMLLLGEEVVVGRNGARTRLVPWSAVHTCVRCGRGFQTPQGRGRHELTCRRRRRNRL